MQHRSYKKTQITKKVGEIIRQIRTEKMGLSCAKFADEYDLDRGNLNRIENGIIDSKLTTLWQVAEALDMKLSDLIKIIENEFGEEFQLIDE